MLYKIKIQAFNLPFVKKYGDIFNLLLYQLLQWSEVVIKTPVVKLVFLVSCDMHTHIRKQASVANKSGNFSPIICHTK